MLKIRFLPVSGTNNQSGLSRETIVKQVIHVKAHLRKPVSRYFPNFRQVIGKVVKDNHEVTTQSQRRLLAPNTRTHNRRDQIGVSNVSDRSPTSRECAGDKGRELSLERAPRNRCSTYPPRRKAAFRKPG